MVTKKSHRAKVNKLKRMKRELMVQQRKFSGSQYLFEKFKSMINNLDDIIRSVEEKL